MKKYNRKQIMANAWNLIKTYGISRSVALKAAWALEKAMMAAESEGDYTKRLAMLEERKSLPAGAVWDYYCLKNDIPVGMDWYRQVKQYEADVLSKR